MTFRMDDLVPLLGASERSDVGFHAGKVESWNQDTGENTVSVAGTALSNVPVLNTGETTALKAGHVVGLLRFKSTYFILGRVAIPGTDQFAAASVAFDAAGHAEAGVGVPATLQTRASVELRGPAWATEAALFLTASVTAVNTSNPGAVDYLRLVPKADGFAGSSVYTHVEPGRLGTAANSQTFSVFREYRSGDFDTVPILLECQIACGAGWPAEPGTTAQVHGLAVFRSTV